MTGTISDLRTSGFGFIASDAHGRPWKLIFRQNAVTADGFNDLRIGQRIRFDQEPLPGNPSRYHAVRVSPLDVVVGALSARRGGQSVQTRN